MSRGGRRPGREALEQWLPAPPALPWWVPSAYIVAVILVGVVLIAVGVVGPGGNGEERADAPVPPPPSEGLRPSPAPNAVGDAVGGGERKDREPEPRLERIRVLDRFTIGVPPGWSRGVLGGAVVLDSPRAARVRVFLEPGRAQPRRLARHATQFLATTHPYARIVGPRRRRLAGRPAFALTAIWSRGRERAMVLSAEGYSYLLLARVEKRAPSRVEAEAEAALESFRPL